MMAVAPKMDRVRWQWLVAIGVPLLLLLFLFVNFRIADEQWRNVISSDGRGYYHYFLEHFINEDHRNFRVESEYLVDRDGKLHNKYPIGTALLLSPFFGIAYLVAFVFEYELNGYEFPFQLFMGLGALFYLVLGAYFTFRLLRTFEVSRGLAYGVVLLVVFGTNLLFYGVMGSTMSHVYSFAAIAAFAWAVRKAFGEFRSEFLFFSLLSLGLVLLIRPFNALVIFAVPFLLAGLPRVGERLRFLISNGTVLAAGVFVVFLLGALQLGSWYLQTGGWLLDSYTDEGFYLLQPQIANVLFSYNKGLFLYTPVMFVAMLGAIYGLFSKWPGAGYFLLFFAGITYLISAWWCWNYASGFGLRPYIDYYSLLAIPLAIMIRNFVVWAKSLIWGILVVLLSFNLVLSYQSSVGILHMSAMNAQKFEYIFLKTDKKYAGILGGHLDVPPYAKSGLVKVAEREVIDADTESTLTDEFEHTQVFMPGELPTGKGKLHWIIELEKMEPELRVAADAMLVIDVGGEGRWPYYEAFKINDIPEYPSGEWVSHQYTINTPKPGHGADVKLYLWNRNRGVFSVRRFNIEVYTPRQ